MPEKPGFLVHLRVMGLFLGNHIVRRLAVGVTAFFSVKITEPSLASVARLARVSHTPAGDGLTSEVGKTHLIVCDIHTLAVFPLLPV